MKKNIGGADRTIRIILGLAILIIGFYYESWWGLLGVIPLFTAFTKSCPLYCLSGISTCKTKTETK